MPLHRKLFVVLLVLVALAAGAVALARMTPAWWSPTARDAAGALDTARSLEQGIASETTKVKRRRQATPARFDIDPEDIQVSRSFKFSSGRRNLFYWRCRCNRISVVVAGFLGDGVHC
jgi:hypothetical protein